MSALQGEALTVSEPEPVATATKCFDRLQHSPRVELLAQARYQHLYNVAIAFFIVRIQMCRQFIFGKHAMAFPYEVLKQLLFVAGQIQFFSVQADLLA